MKKVLSLALVFALILSLGVVAFAGESPKKTTADVVPAPIAEGAPAGAAKAAAGLSIYDADDTVIGTIPEDEITLATIDQAGELDSKNAEAFEAAYEEAQAVTDKTVVSLFWLDAPAKYLELERFGYVRFDFTCDGENVEVTVNGNPMEVVHVDGNEYYAKLTEFGAVCITCD